MKLLRFTLTFIFILSFVSIHFSQGNNNGNIEPVQLCPSDTFLCDGQMTPAPVISVASDLPDLEFIIVDQSVMASNGSGPGIVGIDNDGIFVPSAFGVMPGSTLDVIPVAYNLAAIQATMDELLKGVVFIFPCCSLAGTVCADLNNAGIFCGADITSLEDVFPLFNATGDTLSITDFVTALADANTQLMDPNIPAACGGGDSIDYAYGNSCSYTIYDVIALLNLPDHIISEVVERSDYVESGALVSNSLSVEYYGGNYVELVSPFEVQLGGELLADILVCQ